MAHVFVVCLTVCNFIVHDRCLKGVVSPCVHIATALIEVSCPTFRKRIRPYPANFQLPNGSQKKKGKNGHRLLLAAGAYTQSAALPRRRLSPSICELKSVGCLSGRTSVGRIDVLQVYGSLNATQASLMAPLTGQAVAISPTGPQSID